MASEFDEDVDTGKCYACDAEWPLDEMQKVGAEVFGPCCPQECSDCPAVPTQMDGNEPVCAGCAAERKVAANIQKPEPFSMVGFATRSSGMD